jgi:hypothetical protein
LTFFFQHRSRVGCSVISKVVDSRNLSLNHPAVVGAIQRTCLPLLSRAAQEYKMFWNCHRKPGDTASPGAAFFRDLLPTQGPSAEDLENTAERYSLLSLLYLTFGLAC